MGKGVFLAFLLMFSLLVSNSFTNSAMGASSAVFCARKCKGRCCKAAEGERCLMYCKICCGKCKCVPPGTYGHKEQCPCYNDMKNSKGKSKCP